MVNSNIPSVKKLEPNKGMESGQRNSTFQFHQIPSDSANQTPLKVNNYTTHLLL